MRRQLGLDQDIPDDFSAILETAISVRPFLWPSAFEFYSSHYTRFAEGGSLTTAMHGYWQVVMTYFEQELLGNRVFSLIPNNGFRTIISANPRLLLPTKSTVAYARKKSWSTIFEWQAKENGWYLYVGEYPIGWEKKVKIVNLSHSY